MFYTSYHMPNGPLIMAFAIFFQTSPFTTLLRPCEVQFTEYENAAFSIFIVLITRVLLRFY